MQTNESPAQAGALQGWILTASCWLAVIGAILIAPILPFMEKEFSYLPNANALVTLTLALPALMITIFSPLVGSLVDAIGRKRVLIISLIVYAFAGPRRSGSATSTPLSAHAWLSASPKQL